MQCDVKFIGNCWLIFHWSVISFFMNMPYFSFAAVTGHLGRRFLLFQLCYCVHSHTVSCYPQARVSPGYKARVEGSFVGHVQLWVPSLMTSKWLCQFVLPQAVQKGFHYTTTLLTLGIGRLKHFFPEYARNYNCIYLFQIHPQIRLIDYNCLI